MGKHPSWNQKVLMGNGQGKRRPKGDGTHYDEDEDGFIKCMQQYVLDFCPDINAQLIQMRATMTPEFKFTQGTNVQEHSIQYRLKEVSDPYDPLLRCNF